MKTQKTLIALFIYSIVGCTTMDYGVPEIDMRLEVKSPDEMNFTIPSPVDWRLCERTIRHTLEIPDLSQAGYFYSKPECRLYPWTLGMSVDMQMTFFITSGSTTAWSKAGKLADQANDPLWQEYVREFRTRRGKYAPSVNEGDNHVTASTSDEEIRGDLSTRVFYRLTATSIELAGYFGRKMLLPEYLRAVTRLYASDLIFEAPVATDTPREEPVRIDESSCAGILALVNSSRDSWILEFALDETDCPLPEQILVEGPPWYPNDEGVDSIEMGGGSDSPPSYSVDRSVDPPLYTITK
jgi:hypothetical protein